LALNLATKFDMYTHVYYELARSQGGEQPLTPFAVRNNNAHRRCAKL
jgi:hypothetical protein